MTRNSVFYGVPELSFFFKLIMQNKPLNANQQIKRHSSKTKSTTASCFQPPKHVIKKLLALSVA